LEFLSKNIDNSSKYICEYKPGDFNNPKENGKFGKITLLKK
jgi:hypothetical protein